MDVTYNEIVSWLPIFWAGFRVSIKLTFLALSIGFPLGLAFALAVKAKFLLLRVPALFLVEFGRGTPALVLLQFIYFGLPSANMTLSAFASATIGLAWTVSAYSSEIFRAGLDGVAEGQKQAAIALGLRGVDTYRFILLPQGLRIAMPALMGQAILLFQGTSLCFSISLPEIISRAYDVGSNTFHYFAALTLAGLFFAMVCIPSAFLVSWVEHRSAQASD